MRIAIVGTVGVPARYGGFETLAEQLAHGIAPEHANLIVYCQRSAYSNEERHAPFKHKRVFVPLRANGPSSMLYDAVCMLHAAFVERAESILLLGYSGAWALPLVQALSPRTRLITNIDGMEWRRRKFGAVASRLLRWLERMAVRFSHAVIADNAALLSLARAAYGMEPHLVAYGGDHTLVPSDASPDDDGGYHLAVARIEPENNCHLILEAFSVTGKPLRFVGNWRSTPYGRELRNRYGSTRNIRLLDPIYSQAKLRSIRDNAIGYVHGHSVGGTNPSLVEAVFHTRSIIAFDCSFNRATLDGCGVYFSSVSDLATIVANKSVPQISIESIEELRQRYTWSSIIGQYLRICGPQGSGSH